MNKAEMTRQLEARTSLSKAVARVRNLAYLTELLA